MSGPPPVPCSAQQTVATVAIQESARGALERSLDWTRPSPAPEHPLRV